MISTPGIHHITAVASDPKRNYDFYTKLLGLRFIKKTVNFDDPSTYHFYFGDKIGSPGTILTFFPHPGLPQGRHGLGQAVEIAFAIPKNALAFWIDRFHQKGIEYQGPEKRFNETVIRIIDPDGLMLEFVGVDSLDDQTVWTTEEIGTDVAIRGFHSVALWVKTYEETAAILTQHLGFQMIAQENSRFRFSTGKVGFGQIVDLRCLSDIWQGKSGAGTIHHVAWRVGDDAGEHIVRQALIDQGFQLTPIIDRNYFHSVYFREPNGVLFELATDNPGFTVDEPLESLGQALKLPAQYEAQRDKITNVLLALDD